MEHERFFYFGSDPQAAKWYLLTGSSATPQRMLCLKDYAISKNIVNFGKFTKLDRLKKPHDYCYVIINIFDIPFNELQNFFVMTCDINEYSSSSSKNKNTFDINFKKDFVSGRGKTIPNININTNVEELSDNYLSGLEDMTPNFQWNLNMNVVPCDAPRIPAPKTIITQTNNRTQNDVEDMEIDSDIQENNIIRTNTGTVKRRSDSNNRSPNKIEIRSNQLITPPNNALFENNENFQEISEAVNFPSVAPLNNIVIDNNTIDNIEIETIPLDDDDDDDDESRLSLNIIYEEFNDPVINFSKLTELGSIIKRGKRSDWFNVEYLQQAVIFNSKLLFVPRNYTGNLGDITERYDLHPDVLTLLNKSTSSIFSRYPTFLNDEREKNHLIHNLTTTTGSTGKFDSIVSSKMAEDIINIVDSRNDQEFLQKISETQYPFYILLFGLYRYMKMRVLTYSVFMEIMATLYYGDNKFSFVSELLIKVYFRAKKLDMKLNKNCVNLYHLQRISMQDEDITQIENFMKTIDPSDVNISNNIMNKVFFDVNTNGKIINNSRFCLNLFSIDQNQQYIYTNMDEFYLSTKSLRNSIGLTIDDDYKNRYSDNIFDVFSKIIYRGVASYM